MNLREKIEKRVEKLMAEKPLNELISAAPVPAGTRAMRVGANKTGMSRKVIGGAAAVAGLAAVALAIRAIYKKMSAAKSQEEKERLKERLASLKNKETRLRAKKAGVSEQTDTAVDQGVDIEVPQDSVDLSDETDSNEDKADKVVDELDTITDVADDDPTIDDKVVESLEQYVDKILEE
ncbi:MAG: hypothetical protein ABIA66_02750 [Candidatus Omnitrophota bacterium]